MKKQLSVLLLALLPAFFVTANAQETKADVQPMKPDFYNFESLQKGARLFIDNCMGCHTLEHQRYARMAEDLGFSQEVTEQELILSPELAFNDQMRIAMPKADAEVWFGTAPPDLSLMTRIQSPEYVYNFLRNFYADDSKPWGVNNHVFPDVGMPNVLDGLQKSLSKQDFDQLAYDITNFLTYVAEPTRYQADRLGPRVLIFIAIFFVLSYFLYKEFWRDVK